MRQKAAAAVKAVLAERRAIQTRLRERSTGDVHDRPSGPLQTPLGVTLPAEAVVVVLEELERQGIVVRSETVHSHDGSEYTLCWRLAWT